MEIMAKKLQITILYYPCFSPVPAAGAYVDLFFRDL